VFRGLDSSTAKEVMHYLKQIANKGITVISVVHQPRYEIVQLCDSLLLLAKGGKTVYMGTVPDALMYFSKLGYQCPPFTNPIDYFIDVIGQKIQSEKKYFCRLYGFNSFSLSVADFVKIWSEQELPTREEFFQERKDPYVPRKTAGFLLQFWYYFLRCFIQQLRDLKSLLLDITFNIVPGNFLNNRHQLIRKACLWAL
jgi:ABC-type multidrug transport system ATPase subunit